MSLFSCCFTAPRHRLIRKKAGLKYSDPKPEFESVSPPQLILPSRDGSPSPVNTPRDAASPASLTSPTPTSRSPSVLTSSTDFSALRLLKSALQGSKEQSPDNHSFVPNPTLYRLVSKYLPDVLIQENIVGPDQMQKYADIISRYHYRLFAILVYRSKTRHILEFVEEGIRDADLPFVKGGQNTEPNIVLLTASGRSISTLDGWEDGCLADLFKKQYRMLTPRFKQGEHYEFSASEIVPFTELRHHTEGGFGEVLKACVHADHHDLGQPPTGEVMHLAVKRMFYASDFDPEKKIYDGLGDSDHPNLIKLLFTYEKDGKRHFVFPWADGCLKDYWMAVPVPRLDPKLTHWSVSQMAGIAEGLSSLHEFTLANSENTRYGRHGDINAKNILRFQGQQYDDPGTLVIADLGLAGIHGRESRSNVDPKAIIRTPTYSPPDSLRGCKISRKFDIWSLGCLYLEFATWLVLGYSEIEKFSKLRLVESGNTRAEFRNDYFYLPNNNGVRKSVIDWVNHLKSQPSCPAIIHDLLNLIMTEMIVIKPEHRSSSKEIYKTLRGMLLHCQNFGSYLLPLSTQTSFRPVTIQTDIIPEQASTDEQPQSPRMRATWPQN